MARLTAMSPAIFDQRSILLVVSGSIAAYKSLEIIRILRVSGAQVRVVLTEGGRRFVTELSLAALTESPVYSRLFDLKDETEMGHIRLSREADLVLVCPASADLIAKAAAGAADDLASTVLLATDKPVLMAPAMNHRMWRHPATRRNVARLREQGVIVMEPDEGPMACGEYGPGRLPELSRIMAAIEAVLAGQAGAGAALRPLQGRHVVVTAGPTHEPIDLVRYIGNRSSGRQGFAIAAAAAALGARTTLVAGPVALADPPGVQRVDVTTAEEMRTAVQAALPADAAVLAAAVADWRVDPVPGKIKKQAGAPPPEIRLRENPDILAELAASGPLRPALVVGFAAESERVVEHARLKLARKGADWIVANDISGDVLGGARNEVHLLTRTGDERWPALAKEEVARRLVERIAEALGRADDADGVSPGRG